MDDRRRTVAAMCRPCFERYGEDRGSGKGRRLEIRGAGRAEGFLWADWKPPNWHND